MSKDKSTMRGRGEEILGRGVDALFGGSPADEEPAADAAPSPPEIDDELNILLAAESKDATDVPPPPASPLPSPIQGMESNPAAAVSSFQMKNSSQTSMYRSMQKMRLAMTESRRISTWRCPWKNNQRPSLRHRSIPARWRNPQRQRILRPVRLSHPAQRQPIPRPSLSLRHSPMPPRRLLLHPRPARPHPTLARTTSMPAHCHRGLALSSAVF